MANENREEEIKPLFEDMGGARTQSDIKDNSYEVQKHKQDEQLEKNSNIGKH